MTDTRDCTPVTLPKWVVIELQTGSAAALGVLSEFQKAGIPMPSLAEVDIDQWVEALEEAQRATGYPSDVISS
jgi:hypothetical protein